MRRKRARRRLPASSDSKRKYGNGKLDTSRVPSRSEAMV